MIDKCQPHYYNRNFPNKHYEYNRMTRMALFNSDRWYYRDPQMNHIHFVSDYKVRRDNEGFGERIEVDNFETYLP